MAQKTTTKNHKANNECDIQLDLLIASNERKTSQGRTIWGARVWDVRKESQG